MFLDLNWVKQLTLKNMGLNYMDPLTQTRAGPRPTQGHRHSKARRGPVSSLSAVFPHTPVASRPTKRPVLTTPETVTVTVGTPRRQRQGGRNGPEGEKLIANKDQSEPEVGQHHMGTERGLD